MKFSVFVYYQENFFGLFIDYTYSAWMRAEQLQVFSSFSNSGVFILHLIRKGAGLLVNGEDLITFINGDSMKTEGNPPT
jgi:hypothetical protein